MPMPSSPGPGPGKSPYPYPEPSPAASRGSAGAATATATTTAATVLAVAVTALAPASWGTTYSVTTELLPPDRPVFTALTRALPAGLALLALTRVLPRGVWWARVAVLGALNFGLFFPLLFVAAYRLPGGVAAILGAAAPLFVAALSLPLLAVRPTVRTLAAGVAGLAGVGLVVLRGDARIDAPGVAAGVLGVASMAAATVLGKRWGRPEGVGPLAFAGWQLTAGGLLLLPVALLAEGAPPALDGRAVGGYALLTGVLTAVPYVLWFRGIGRLPATSVAFLGLLSPVTAAVIGWAVLGEALTPVQLAGMAVALGATVLGQQRQPPSPRRTQFPQSPPPPQSPRRTGEAGAGGGPRSGVRSRA